ncbi:MAG: hypothetical protein MJA27_18210 [Pseudanabaenales cyanobacterium]|nr:hypothetical protein [Pseudanabaenales cyanobacterium]
MGSLGQESSEKSESATIAALNCIDYTLHPTPYTPPSRDVFNPSENCYKKSPLPGWRRINPVRLTNFGDPTDA